MKTIRRKISELRHPEQNVRVHTELQIDELVRSLDMFGQIRPVVIDEAGVILAGNGTVAAMRKRGDEEAAVWVMAGLSEDQKIKLMLADNKLFHLGLDDHNVIMAMVRELDDLQIPGFDEEVLRALTAEVSQVREDKLAEFGALPDEEIERAIERQIPVGSTEPPATPAMTKHEVICPSCGHIFEP